MNEPRCTNPACGHAEDVHSALVGCLTEDCDCEAYAAPTSEVGRTIPARHTDPGTSHGATRAILVKAGTQRAKLLLAFAHGPAEGLTDEEAMEAAEGVSPVSEYAKRCSELRDGGFIAATGSTRRGGAGVPRIVSTITEHGTHAAKAL